jgi:AcrR family transcriptional regulator
MPNKKDPKQNILDTSIALIAKKGFSAVGVREIAKKSKVNISMISYYFGGKTGILKAIIETYFTLVGDILKDIIDVDLPAETELKKVITGRVKLINEKENLCRVALLEMPLDVPEIANYKLEMVKRNMRFVGKKLEDGFNISDKTKHVIIGHAFISLVYSNFIFGKLRRKEFNIIFDDKFFETYTDIITTIFLHGVYGINDVCCPDKRNQKNKNNKK